MENSLGSGLSKPWTFQVRLAEEGVWRMDLLPPKCAPVPASLPPLESNDQATGELPGTAELTAVYRPVRSTHDPPVAVDASLASNHARIFGSAASSCCIVAS